MYGDYRYARSQPEEEPFIHWPRLFLLGLGGGWLIGPVGTYVWHILWWVVPGYPPR